MFSPRQGENAGHVPLSPQALTLLAELRTMSGKCEQLFPSFIDLQEPIRENTILACIYRPGYRGRLTGHGCGSMFSTWVHEAGYSIDAVERQLGHARADRVKAARARTQQGRVSAKDCDQPTLVPLPLEYLRGTQRPVQLYRAAAGFKFWLQRFALPPFWTLVSHT